MSSDELPQMNLLHESYLRKSNAYTSSVPIARL